MEWEILLRVQFLLPPLSSSKDWELGSVCRVTISPRSHRCGHGLILSLSWIEYNNTSLRWQQGQIWGRIASCQMCFNSLLNFLLLREIHCKKWGSHSHYLAQWLWRDDLILGPDILPNPKGLWMQSSKKSCVNTDFIWKAVLWYCFAPGHLQCCYRAVSAAAGVSPWPLIPLGQYVSAAVLRFSIKQTSFHFSH